MEVNPRKPRNLAIQIYAALLGTAPKIARRSIDFPRLKVRLWVETAVSRSVDSPFHRPSFREQVERIAAGAVLALGDAGDRLRRSRETVNRAQPPRTGPKPVVLIGPAAMRSTRRPTPSTYDMAKDTSTSEAA